MNQVAISGVVSLDNTDTFAEVQIASFRLGAVGSLLVDGMDSELIDRKTMASMSRV